MCQTGTYDETFKGKNDENDDAQMYCLFNLLHDIYQR
jgi:hypothetical protein